MRRGSRQNPISVTTHPKCVVRGEGACHSGPRAAPHPPSAALGSLAGVGIPLIGGAALVAVAAGARFRQMLDSPLRLRTRRLLRRLAIKGDSPMRGAGGGLS